MNTPCMNCNNKLTATDRTADPYTKLCRTCWSLWGVDAGAPLLRYPTPGTVCAACGMGFGGTTGFDRHRHQDRCLSPAKLKAQNRPLTIKAGIWVDAYRGNAQISPGERPRSDSTKKSIAG